MNYPDSLCLCPSGEHLIDLDVEPSKRVRCDCKPTPPPASLGGWADGAPPCERCGDLFYHPKTLIECEKQRAAEWEEIAIRERTSRAVLLAEVKEWERKAGALVDQNATLLVENHDLRTALKKIGNEARRWSGTQQAADMGKIADKALEAGHREGKE